ncbi:GIY-YIG nuclease family protein [Patescibacteria group bacterium]|nr:GIY-YIG nuclease family protein [Patescibacteria group bacterium]
MFYVYILRSLKNENKLYIGVTRNRRRRLKQHNSDTNTNSYSAKFKPWVLECYIAFKNKYLAIELEKYLKQGSGFAFMKKRLLP